MQPLKLTIKRKADLLRMCKKLFPEYNEIRFGSVTAEGDIAEYDKKFRKTGLRTKDPISCDFLWFEKDFKYKHDADIERSATYVIHWLELCFTHLSHKIIFNEANTLRACNHNHAGMLESTMSLFYREKYAIHPVDYLYLEYLKLNL
jgi:hypothetical protein